MPMTRTVGAEAADKNTGMTIDELGALIQQAMRSGATGSEVIEVSTVGWMNPRIKTAKVAFSWTASTDR